MGTETRTVGLISAPDQPGKTRMYQYTRESKKKGYINAYTNTEKKQSLPHYPVQTHFALHTILFHLLFLHKIIKLVAW